MPHKAASDNPQNTRPRPWPMPNRTPSFKLVVKPKISSTIQRLGFSWGMPSARKAHHLVARSTDAPSAAMVAYSTTCARGTRAMVPPIRSSGSKSRFTSGQLAAFELLGAFDAQGCIRDRVQAGLADLAAAILALAEHAILDFFDRAFDRFERQLIGLHQAERELLLIIVAADIGH